MFVTGHHPVQIGFGGNMTRLKKVVSGLIFLVLLGVVSSWGYVVVGTLSNFELLLLCSQGKDEVTPKSLCQSYLFNFGGRPEDIAALNEGIGVGWVIRAEDEADRTKLVSFLLEKGVNIDAIDQRSGITALHTAVIENDLPAVKLLLKNGANPSVKDRSRGKTPLEFAFELKGKSTQPDRAAIILALQNVPESASFKRGAQMRAP